MDQRQGVVSFEVATGIGYAQGETPQAGTALAQRHHYKNIEPPSQTKRTPND